MSLNDGIGRCSHWKETMKSQQRNPFQLFQLFSTYYGEDERLNIGPKRLHWRKNMVVQLTGILKPMQCLCTSLLAKPEVTKNLLKYRHNQLPQAIHNAQQQGLKGALYPMVTFTGVECHNEWEITLKKSIEMAQLPTLFIIILTTLATSTI